MEQQPLREELCNGYAASLVSVPCGEVSRRRACEGPLRRLVTGRGLFMLCAPVSLGLHKRHIKAPELPGFCLFFPLASFLSPYRLKFCICQYDCVHARTLHSHLPWLPVQVHM